MADILQEIETKYPVSDVRVNGRQIWPYLREHYWKHNFNSGFVNHGEQRHAVQPPLVGSKRFFSLRWWRILIRHVFHGFPNWFRKYEYVVFANVEKNLIDGRYTDRFLYPIIDELGPERVFCLESASSLCPVTSEHTLHVVSMRPVLVLVTVMVRLKEALRRKHVIENPQVLDAIEMDYSFGLDAAALIESFEASYSIFKRLFRALGTRVVFMTRYSSHQAAIRAAKDLRIKVVEVQHGVIEGHPAYNVHCDLDRSCFPDYMLVFGKRELGVFDNVRFIDPGNVYSVGSYIIDHIKNSYRPEPYLSERLSGYKKVVGVTLQWSLEKSLIGFICEAAQLDGDIFYMLIPRNPENEAYTAMELPANVAVVRDRNFYQMMAYVDFHSTVFSTCALEAPSLGVQNILVDIDGLAKAYYQATLADTRITRFVYTPEELVEIVNTFPVLDRDTICKLNEDIIVTNYRENIRRFIRECFPRA